MDGALNVDSRGYAISHGVSKVNTFFSNKTQWQGKSQVKRLTQWESISEVLYFRFFVMSITN